jgi:hypothetical protein
MTKIIKNLTAPKIVIAIFLTIIISGCQNLNDWMEKSDSEFAEKIYTSKSKDVCTMSKQNFGPRTKYAIQKTIQIRRLDCDELMGSDRVVETPAQREKRINDAIQLLNSAAQMSSPTNNQTSPPWTGGVCHLSGQSRSGLYKNCAYNCVSGTVYRTVNNTDICPISVNQ